MDDEHVNAPATSTPISAGLTDPVHDSQQAFRALLDAMARPGTAVVMPVTLTAMPLPPTMAAAILTLADHETVIWLDAALAANPQVAPFLRFATGARLTNNPAVATFALVSDPPTMPSFDSFAQGTPEYPDRSTTILLCVDELNDDSGNAAKTMLAMSGPGIDGTAQLSFAPTPPRLVEQLTANRARFPMGIDLFLCGATHVAAVPRSTKLTGAI